MTVVAPNIQRLAATIKSPPGRAEGAEWRPDELARAKSRRLDPAPPVGRLICLTKTMSALRLRNPATSGAIMTIIAGAKQILARPNEHSNREPGP